MTPLTREQILEHALRKLVEISDPADVRVLAYDLSTGNVSVLDMRAAEALRAVANAFNEERGPDA